MCKCCCDCDCKGGPELRLGHPVPDFELTTYEPTKKDFGKKGGWTILFFYPADFTFV